MPIYCMPGNQLSGQSFTLTHSHPAKNEEVIENQATGAKTHENPLIGINAKTRPYPGAGSWSEGRRCLLVALFIGCQATNKIDNFSSACRVIGHERERR